MIDRFLEYLRYERNFSVHTVFAYKNDLIQFATFLSGVGRCSAVVTPDGSCHFDAMAVQIDDVREWVLHNVDDAKFKSSSVHRKVSSLNSYFRFLYVKGFLPDNHRNPVSGVVLPKKSKNLPTFFLETDMDECLGKLADSDDYNDMRNLLIIEMIYQTGLRRSELTGLNDSDIDLSGKKLKVLGKGNKERVVPFGDDLAERIVSYLGLRDQLIQRHDDSFFVSRTGIRISGQGIYQIVHNIMSQISKQRKISPHVLRHTFATAMLNHGADLNVIKELLGHESIATTQIYTHVTFEQLREEYKKSHPRGGE